MTNEDVLGKINCERRFKKTDIHRTPVKERIYIGKDTVIRCMERDCEEDQKQD